MQFIKIREHEEMLHKACDWFHSKWSVSMEAYEQSMFECLDKKASVPQWYIAVENDEIVAGMGVIENDVHERTDLTPNVCAVFVEEEHRCKGIAKDLLQYVCDDMDRLGIGTLYLISEHTSFYEKCGWEFLCMVQGNEDSNMIRMYVHRSRTM